MWRPGPPTCRPRTRLSRTEGSRLRVLTPSRLRPFAVPPPKAHLPKAYLPKEARGRGSPHRADSRPLVRYPLAARAPPCHQPLPPPPPTPHPPHMAPSLPGKPGTRAGDPATHARPHGTVHDRVSTAKTPPPCRTPSRQPRHERVKRRVQRVHFFESARSGRLRRFPGGRSSPQ